MRDTAVLARGRGAALPALAVAGLGAAAIAVAWALEAHGYSPCELCLKERIPYYVGIPLALVVAAGARGWPGTVLRAGYGLVALVFAAGAVLGAYHAGVEWKLWPGPGECSGVAAAPAAVGDFLKQLETVSPVRCDEAALRVFGLSLAAWNALLAAALAALAGLGWWRSRPV